jgi:insulysin
MIEIAFGVPYQYPHYEHKPMDVLSHLIGHEGPGSIHAFLKNKGWLVSLECSSQPLGRGFDVLRITMSLTKEGVSE